MKYLLDTHSFLWSVTDFEKLSGKVREIVADIDNEVFVSVVTFWEMSLKYSVGKIDFGGYAVENFTDAARKSQITILQLDPLIAASSYELPWPGTHRDPFDRMLIWTAIKNDFFIISKDANFKLYTDLGLKLIW